MCGINLSHASAFHLAANGLLERMFRSRQAAIMWRAQERWTEDLPLVLEMRTAFKNLQASVSELVYGEPLHIPGELLAAPPPPGIYQSSLHNAYTISSNFGQSQRHVTPHPMSLYTRTWQILLMSSSGRVQNGATFNRPTVALTRSWPAHENRCGSR